MNETGFILLIIPVMATTFPGGIFIVLWGRKRAEKYKTLESANKEFIRSFIKGIVITFSLLPLLGINNTYADLLMAWLITIMMLYYVGKLIGLHRIIARLSA